MAAFEPTREAVCPLVFLATLNRMNEQGSAAAVAPDALWDSVAALAAEGLAAGGGAGQTVAADDLKRGISAAAWAEMAAAAAQPAAALHAAPQFQKLLLPAQPKDALANWDAWRRAAAAPLPAAPPPGRTFRAVVLGASGAVGSALLAELRAAPDVEAVTLVTRRPVAGAGGCAKSREEVVDLADPDGVRGMGGKLAGHEVAFVTLGIGAAGKATKAELERVDLHTVAAFAAAARSGGVRHLSLLTAIGADSKAEDSGETTYGGSGTYNQIKGKLEDAVTEMKFPGSLRIFRPAAILGTPHTPEALAAVAPWLNPLLAAERHGSTVTHIAQGMLAEARRTVHECSDGSARVLDVAAYLAAAGNRPPSAHL